MIRRPTWVMLLIFLLVLGTSWYWQTRNSESTPATPTPQQYLVGVLSTEIVALRIEDSLSRAVQLHFTSEGDWELAEPEIGKADTEVVESVLNQVAGLLIVSTVDPAPALDAVGLQNPVYTLHIRIENGDSWMVSIGDLTPTSSGYYARASHADRDSDSPVVIVNKFAVDSALRLLDSPPLLSTPEPGNTPAETPGG